MDLQHSDTWWSDGNTPHDIDHEAADAKGVSYRLAACWDVGLEPDEEKSLLDWPLGHRWCHAYHSFWHEGCDGVRREPKHVRFIKLQLNLDILSVPAARKKDFGAQYIRCTNWMSFRFFRVGTIHAAIWGCVKSPINLRADMAAWMERTKVHFLMRESKKTITRPQIIEIRVPQKLDATNPWRTYTWKGLSSFFGENFVRCLCSPKGKNLVSLQMITFTEAATSEKLKPSFAFRPIKHARIAPSTLET